MIDFAEFNMLCALKTLRWQQGRQLVLNSWHQQQIAQFFVSKSAMNGSDGCSTNNRQTETQEQYSQTRMEQFEKLAIVPYPNTFNVNSTVASFIEKYDSIKPGETMKHDHILMGGIVQSIR